MSKSSQVRSAYFGLIQVWETDGRFARETIGLRVVSTEVRRSLVVGLKGDVSPLNDVHCDWALDRAHEVP